MARVRRDVLRRRSSERLAGLAGPAATGRSPIPAWFVPLAAWLAPALPVDQAWMRGLALAFLTVVWGAVVAPVGTAVIAVLVVGSGAGLSLVLTRRPVSRRAYLTDLLSSLGELQAALGAGASLTQALGHAGRGSGPSAVDLARVDATVRAGASVQVGLDQWARERQGTGADLLADALSIAGATGGSQLGAVTAVVHTLRDRQARAREVRALASQARASASVLAVTPLAFTVVVSFLDRRVGAFLVATPAGWGCLFGGLLLDAVGVWWMSALIGRVR